MKTFALDNRLQRDTILIGEATDSLLLLMNDCRYPWFIVVPTIADVSEWFDLPTAVQASLHGQCIQLGKCIRQAFECEKINIAALGNIVRQMHIHVIGRFEQDPAWPGPVWGHSPAIAYDEQQLARCKDLLLAQQDLPFNLL